MTILYTVVARSSDGIILSEASTGGLRGNHPQVTAQLITSIKNDPSYLAGSDKITFVHRPDAENASDIDHFFHVITVKGLFLICLSDDSLAREQNVNFSYLQNVHNEFEGKYSRSKIERANAYGMEQGFSRNMSKLMHEYNLNRATLGQHEKVSKLTAEIESLKVVMGHNIRFALERGHNIEGLVETSDQLVEEARIFEKRSDDVRLSMKRKSQYHTLFIVAICVFGVYILAAIKCGFNLKKCKSN